MQGTWEPSWLWAWNVDPWSQNFNILIDDPKNLILIHVYFTIDPDLKISGLSNA